MIYFALDNILNVVKIGYTTNLNKRLIGLQTGSSNKLQIIKVCEGTRNNEKYLHNKFANYNTSEEWFNYVGELQEYVQNLEELTSEKYVETIEEVSEDNIYRISLHPNRQTYINTSNKWHSKLNSTEFQLLVELVSQESFKTYYIHLDNKLRGIVADNLKLSDVSIKRLLAVLLKTPCLKRVSRGVYIVNPNYIWSGSQPTKDKKSYIFENINYQNV